MEIIFTFIAVILSLFVFYVVGFKIMEEEEWPPETFREVFRVISLLYLIVGAFVIAISIFLIGILWVGFSFILS